MKPIVVLDDVWKTYRMGEVDVPAIRGVSLEIKQGDFVAVTGPSGSGKSTMLNMIGCLDAPTRGTIHLKGQSITTLPESRLSELRGRTIGFIFQQYNLIPSVDAYSNVILPLEFQEVDDDEADKRVREVMERVGLGGFMHHLPTELSGGQQQRVAIARCLVSRPEMILADEPTGSLDSVTGENIIGMLREFWEEGKTVVIVTHNPELAKFAHTTVGLQDGMVVETKVNKETKR